MRKLVLNTKTTEKTGVVIEHGKVQEYVIERPEVQSLSGSIFYGKITYIDHGLQAAFVDIGEERNAFLSKEAIPWNSDKMESAVKDGEMLYVQAIKEPIGTKGAQVTADIALPGVYVVYQPYGRKISLSKKLNEKIRGELEKKIASVLKKTEGAIVRTASQDVDEEVMIEELDLLKKQWENLLGKADKKPGRLWKDSLIPNQIIRKFPISSIHGIYIDDVHKAKEVKLQFPSVREKIHWKKEISKEMPTSLLSLQREITDPIVDLGNGIQLIIEQTEALVVIDVNSHQMKGKAFSHSQAFQVNKKAAVEIQRQIRLRDLAGMIVIDFLTMKDPTLKKRLESEMKKLIGRDPVKTMAYGMTRLGLFEMTRKRNWTSPAALLSEKTEVKFTQETLVYRLERELWEASSNQMEALLIAVHPDFNELKKQLLSEPISSKIPQELFVRQDSSIYGYQIELEGSLDMIREAVQRRGYHVDNLF